MNKCLSFGVALAVLLLIVVFAPQASADAPLHPTNYVNCGPKRLPTFGTIQAAVDNAGGGYTIKVCKGNYVENVNVNDANMHGAPPFNTLDGLQIVDDEGVKLTCSNPALSGFDLHANSVTIQGFEITGCASGITVEATYGLEVIAGNRLWGNGNGISFNPSTGGNSVIDNEITKNTNDGIFDFSTPLDLIFDNDLQNNGANGVEISTSGLNAAIEYNTAEGNGANGIYLNHAASVLIGGNTLIDNGNDGLYLNNSAALVISGNTADRNEDYGIELSSTSPGSTLVNNRMAGNELFDITDHTGPPSGNTYLNNHCGTSTGSAPAC